ncbi:MFS transporter [Sporolactobacillus laevolacticus]|uniref:MFS transporter n=1 Tax=Sporolactobacillus laevolacticus TaxID=33018 RepID=UPI0025B559EB|nr:MFS transporter [Sporolactobacillus laevolacticus]MDN3955174.1 MFS transporter [Sporolactobacillus laevolacticus]
MRQFTFASCALYFLTGLTAISIGSVMPELLNYYHISYTIGGRLIFVGAMGFLTGVLLTSWLNRRFQPKPILTISALVIAFAQFSILLLPPFPLFMTLYFINSVGSAAIGIVVATMFIEVFIGRQAVAMSYLEVSFGLGAFTMPLLASFFIAHGIWRYLFVLTAVLAVVLAIVWTRISYSKQAVDQGEPLDASGSSDAQHPLSANLKWIVLGLFALIVFLYGGLEGSLNNFMSSIFIHYLNQAAYYASISVGIFWGAMVIGRAATAIIIRKLTYSTYLLINIIGSIVSLVLFIVLKNALMGYIFVGTLGLMMSGIYSITLVYANYSIPNSAHLVTPIISGLSGLGSAIFPALTGFAIDRAGMTLTLWYIVSIATAYLIFLLVINRLRSGRPILSVKRWYHTRPAIASRRARYK